MSVFGGLRDTLVARSSARSLGLWLGALLGAACTSELPDRSAQEGSGNPCGPAGVVPTVGPPQPLGIDSAVVVPGGLAVPPVSAALRGDALEVLSSQRGLQTLDVADRGNPRWQARLPLVGEPLGFFPRGGGALVVTRWLEAYELCPSCPGGVKLVRTGRLTLVDLTAPNTPSVRVVHDLGGRVAAAAIIDGRLVTVTNRAPNAAAGPLAIEQFALDQADALPRLGQAEVSGWGHGSSVLISGHRLFIAHSANGDARRAVVTIVDVDPAGPVIARGQRPIDGAVRSAHSLGLVDQGRALGVVTHDHHAVEPGSATLHTFQVTDAGDLAPLATTPLPDPSAAVAFGPDRLLVAGTKLSVVHLANPAAPSVAAASAAHDHADGVRLVGDAALVFGHQRRREDRPAVEASLYDVRDPARPIERARVAFQLEGYNFLSGGTEGIAAHWLSPDNRLLVLPLNAVRDGGTTHEARLAFVDVDIAQGTLGTRGDLPGSADARSLFPLPDGRLLAAGAQVRVLDPRSPPQLGGTVDLERFIMDMAIDGDHAVQLVGDPDGGNNELHLVRAADPEAAVPLATQPARAVAAEVLARAGRAYVIATEPRRPDPGATRIDLYDVAPGLRRRGSITVPFRLSRLTVPRYDDGLEAALVGDTTVALRPTHSRLTCTDVPCPDADVYFVDARDPDAPVLAGKVAIDGAKWAGVVSVVGTRLFVAHHTEPERYGADLGPRGRFWVTEIDAADPARPSAGPALETPGLLLGVRGSLYYSASFSRDTGPCATGEQTTLRVSRREPDGRLVVLGSIDLPGVHYGRNILIEGEAAFANTLDEILAIDLRDPTRPRIAGRSPLAPGWAPEAAGPGVLLSRTAAYRVDANLTPRLDRLIDAPWARVVRVFPAAGQAVVPKGQKGVEVLPLQAP